MKYNVNGKPVSLTKSNFVASGGEGSVYAHGGLAYKIYNNQSKMIPTKKISELGKLTDPHIIRPIDIVEDSNGKAVGYTMKQLKKAEALCRLFTKAFKERNNVSHDGILKLVRQMQAGVQHCHDNGIILVDLNELNFLVDDKFKEVFFIDVDSYQTPSFPATALMESIRDRHCPKVGGSYQFSTETDWFSWGIVTFQMFVGIHPYKGRHPRAKGLDERMNYNLSVFNPDVSIPKVCYSFDVIPPAYRDWYKDIFEEGKRMAPPHGTVSKVGIVKKVSIIRGSDKLDMKEIETYSGGIVACYKWNGIRIALTTDGINIGKTKLDVPPNAKIGISPKMNRIISATVDGGKINVKDLTIQYDVKDELFAEEVMSYGGRIYFKSDDSIFEIQLIEQSKATRATSKVVANVMSQSTKMYDGVVIQNMLGSCYVSVFPKAGTHQQVRIKELEGHKIVDAKYENNILMVIGFENGKYDRFTIRFDSTFSSYDTRVTEDVVYYGLNFAVLDNGICVQINEDENLVLMRNVKDDNRITVVDDDAINSDMKLFSDGDRAVIGRGEKLYSLTMK